MGGNHSDQLNYPGGFVIDKNGTIFICDEGNRRIQRWYKNDNQGYTLIRNISCWDVAMDNEGSLYISDANDKHRVTKLPGEKVVAGGNGKGNALNQLANPYGLFIDQNKSIFIADGQNYRVVQWVAGATEGTIVAGGNGDGQELNQLDRPMSIILDQMGTMYVVEYQNHRVTRWFKTSETGIVIVGGRGEGDRDDQLRNPINLVFDRDGNLFVADYFNHRIQKFTIDKSSCKTNHVEKNVIN
jgi:sugar lactone lactonase YvrE